ncbi:regulator of G protein [Daphnia sinensis]|uniref:Regulator of G protein n=1 Tax=Daphnia sinensis TaxID=1820382 RepID=A0AAD5PLK1_9CRUS|nr:regulator of G protein [Daphnia sinensis]
MVSTQTLRGVFGVFWAIYTMVFLYYIYSNIEPLDGPVTECGNVYLAGQIRAYDVAVLITGVVMAISCGVFVWVIRFAHRFPDTAHIKLQLTSLAVLLAVVRIVGGSLQYALYTYGTGHNPVVALHSAIQCIFIVEFVVAVVVQHVMPLVAFRHVLFGRRVEHPVRNSALNQLLADPEQREKFRLFLAAEFAVENLHFIELVIRYRAEPSHYLACTIHGLYIIDGAPFGVNISSRVRAQCMERYFNHPVDLYDYADREIRAMLIADKVPRFLERAASHDSSGHV